LRASGRNASLRVQAWRPGSDVDSFSATNPSQELRNRTPSTGVGNMKSWILRNQVPLIFLFCGLCVLTGCGGGGAATGSNTPRSGSSGQNASFSLTGSMQTPRSSHTATLLNNGKVLIAGGKDSTGTALAATELFDPSTNVFSSTGNMNFARWDHTATLLNDGRVLVVGGGSGTAELFDPNTATFILTGSTTFTGSGITATLLKDGRVLVAGGGTATAELFDPSNGRFSPAGSMSTARTGAAASLLNDGRVLVAGGTDSNGSALGDLFDPASTTFSQTSTGGTQALSLTSTLLANGSVLLAGGETTTLLSGGSTRCCLYGPVSTALGTLFNPNSTVFSVVNDMSAARTFHTATLLGSGKVLIAGGASVQSMARQGKVLTSNTSLAGAELFNPANGDFVPTGNMTTPRFSHTATVLGDGRVLVTGGIGTSGVTLATAELYQ
jgi:WD40 repeat protein